MPVSHKPTHLTPLNESEKLRQNSQRMQPGNRWAGGIRFNKIKNRGKGGGGNSGTRTKKTPKLANSVRPVYLRPTTMPRWARKYA
jgi:hypothetical protein